MFDGKSKSLFPQKRFRLCLLFILFFKPIQIFTAICFYNIFNHRYFILIKKDSFSLVLLYSLPCPFTIFMLNQNKFTYLKQIPQFTFIFAIQFNVRSHRTFRILLSFFYSLKILNFSIFSTNDTFCFNFLRYIIVFNRFYVIHITGCLLRQFFWLQFLPSCFCSVFILNKIFLKFFLNKVLLNSLNFCSAAKAFLLRVEVLNRSTSCFYLIFLISF